MLAVDTFVFSVVFKARWGGTSESRAEFAILLFAGLIVHSLFAECINRAPNLIFSNVNYVKKIVVPLEVLPWVVLGATLFHTIASVIVLLLFYLFIQGGLQWTIVFLPFVLAPLIILTLGITWFFAPIGVYLRDPLPCARIAQVVK